MSTLNNIKNKLIGKIMNADQQDEFVENIFDNLDVAAFKSMLMAADDEDIKAYIHACRYEFVGYSVKERVISGEWLRDNGYGRLFGRDLLPQGELPK